MIIIIIIIIIWYITMILNSCYQSLSRGGIKRKEAEKKEGKEEGSWWPYKSV